MEDNQDDLELKRRARRRLVGAIALVVLVVIVLPIVFDHEPRTITQDLTIQIPSQDGGKFPSLAIAPVIDPALAPSKPSSEESPPVAAAPVPMNSPRPSVAANPRAAEPTAAPATEPVVASPEQAVRTEAPKSQKSGQGSEVKPAPKPAQRPAKEAPKTAQSQAPTADADPAQPVSFFVPLGSFSKQENVRLVQSKVSAAGFKIFSEKSAGSTQTRVRAGPFPTREAAENAREKLKSAGVDVGPVGSR